MGRQQMAPSQGLRAATLPHCIRHAMRATGSKFAGRLFVFFSLSLTACRGTDGLVIGVVSDDADADAQAYVICHTLFKQRTGTGKRASEDDGSIRSHVKRHVWMASLVAPSQSN